MNDLRDKLKICLEGQFSIRSDNGRTLTPRGKKAVGLVATLATSQQMRRPRRWLESMFWSDRADDQARGSLRQTLFEIKKSLGEYSDILQADRMSVWLDANRITLAEPVLNDAQEFLEGLSIADPNFSAWLAGERLARSGGSDRRDLRPNAPHIVKIQCGAPWVNSDADNVAARAVDGHIGALVSNFIAHSKCAVLGTNADMIVRTATQDGPEGSILFVQFVDARRDELIHTESCVVPDMVGFLADQTQLGRFCWMAVDQAIDKLAAHRRDVDPAAYRAALAQDAINSVLSFKTELMPQSLDILRRGIDDLDAGLFHALHGWAMMSLIMEDRVEEDSATLSNTRRALQTALQVAPADPMVNGLAANVEAILFGDFDRARSLASGALRSSPSNVFALQALSLCRLETGAHDQAYRLSRHNRDVAEFTKFGPMSDLHHALLCLRTGRPQEAKNSAKAAAAAVPDYRAPHRQLVALYAADGQFTKVNEEAEHMANIEPEFTLERLLFDHSYPSNTLRATGYLEKAKRNLKAV